MEKSSNSWMKAWKPGWDPKLGEKNDTDRLRDQLMP
jgi:hypothetical protein